MSDNKAQLEISADASGVEAGVSGAKRSLRELGATAATAGKEASAAISGIGSGGDGAAAKVDRAAKSLIGSIQRTTAAMEAGGKVGSEYYRVLASQRGVDANLLKPYLDQLDAVTAKQKAAGQGLNNLGVSAAQTAAALRGVPAQFTDIITSLQGGQAPMTVLLQQGGQLKDMFGGVGNAVRAVGGYVVGLVNPLSLAVLAAGGLAYAMNKGSDEALAYNRALILSGNAAGTTAGQLQQAAKGIAAVVGTQGNAAEALVALANGGRVAGDNLQRYGQIAVQIERTIGTSFADTAKTFADLAKTPLETTIKLNEQYHYLTASVYEQIKSLQERGRVEEAGTLAQKAYADGQDNITTRLKANMGPLSAAWKELATDAAKAWDAMLGLGRVETVEEKLKAVSDRIAARNAEAARAGFASNGGGAAFGGVQSGVDAKRARDNEADRESQAYLREAVTLNKRLADIDAERARGVEARKEFLKLQDAYLSNAKKLENERDEIAARGKADGRTAKEIAALQGIAAQKYDTGAALAAVSQAAQQREEILKRSQSNIDTLLATGVIREREQIQETTRIELEAIASRKQAVQAELAIVSRRQNSEKEVVALKTSIAALDEQYKTRALTGSNQLTVADYARARAIEAVVAAEKELFKAEVDADYVARSKGREAAALAVTKYEKSIADANEQINFEYSLLGKTNDQRAVAIAQYQIEFDLKKRIAEIDANTNFDTEDQRANERRRLRAAADQAQAAVLINAQSQQFTRLLDGVDSTAEQLWRDLRTGGDDAAKNIGKSFVKALDDAFYQIAIKPWVLNVTANILGVNAGGAGSALGAAGGLGNLGNVGTIANNALNFAGFGSGSSMFTQFAGSGIGQSLGLSATVDAIGGLETATTALTGAGNLFAAAMPWVAGGAALLALFGGNGFKSSAPTGSNVSNFDAAGNLASYRTSSSNDASAVADKIVNDLQAAYSKSAMSLGIGTTGTNFSYAGNTGAQGENPNFALGGGAGGKSFYQGETGLSDAAVSLAASRAVFAALQGSDLPQYLRSVFDGITAGSATQDQLAASLAYAASLKQVRDALLETRAPLQILQDNLAAGTASLHTSAESFKADFLAAIDAGITPEQLQQWQALQSTMDQLAAASGKAENAITAVTRSLADIAAERTRLQDQFDELTMTSAQLLAKQRSAIDESNRALFDQVQAQVALKDAAAAAASAASAAAAAYVAAAQAQAQAASQRLGTVTGGATEALAGLSRAIEAQRAQDTAAYQAQRIAATAIFNAQSSALQSNLDDINASLGTVTDSVGKLKSLSSSLKGTLDGMRILGSEGDYRSGAQAQISDALAKARAGGGLPMDGQLESALRTVSQPSEKLFGSFVDYAKDFYKTANDIAALSALTDSQLTADQITQSILKDQADKLGDQQKTLKDGFADQVSTLDAILKNAQSQLDAANGLNTSVLSVADALQAFQASIIALTTERATQNLATSRGTTYSASDIIGGVKAMLASGASVSQIYDTGAKDYGLGASAITAATTGQGLVGFDTATGTRMQDYAQGQIADAIKAFMAVGATPADVYRVGGTDYGLSPAEIARAARAAGIPGFRVGTNRVPQDMLALVHKDEMIVPAQYNPAAGGVGNTARLEALVEQLTQKVAELQESSERGNFEIKRGSDAANGRQAAPIMVQLVDKNGALV